MKAKELRELDNAALNEKLVEARQELFNLRFPACYCSAGKYPETV